MTSFGYIAAKAISFFGFNLSDHYRNKAAFESHLLRESEEVLGSLIWQDIENVDELAADYWKLRKLEKENRILEERIEKLNEELEVSQQARSEALQALSEKNESKVEERDRILREIEILQDRHDETLRDGRAIKRSHSGLKAKFEVLSQEGADQVSLEETRNELRKLKIEFENLRKERQEISAKIGELSKKQAKLNQEISSEGAHIRQDAESQFNNIGKVNKELSKLKLEVENIQAEVRRIYCLLGRYAIGNAHLPEIRMVLKPHAKLVRLIQEIDKSFNRHSRLHDYN